MLETKFDKVNMSKYHQAVTSSKRQMQFFALKAFYLGIACEALGHKLHATVKKPKKTPAAPAVVVIADAPVGSGAASSGDPMPAAAADPNMLDESTLTLAQASFAQQLGSNMNPDNQLSKAGIEYGDVGNYFKQSIIVKTLGHLARFHGAQNQRLRSLDDTIPWELEQMRDKHIFAHQRLTMVQLTAVRHYEACGIEAEWQPVLGACLNDARVAMANDYAEILFDVCTTLVAEESNRNIGYTHGWPKRFTLLLDETTRADTIDELKGDLENTR